MSSYHAAVAAARHGRRAAPRLPSPPTAAIASGVHRPFFVGASSSLAPSDGCSSTAASPAVAARTGARPMCGTSLTAGLNVNSMNSRGGPLAVLAAATLTLATGYTIAGPILCEPKDDEDDGRSNAALADESDDGGPNAAVEDGMDAGSETIKPTSPHKGDTSRAPADADEDDDDPSNDEDTSCSICLINRQGPCRKHWLKFERCMKEHGAEKDRADRERAERARAVENEAEKEAEKNEKEGEEGNGEEGGWIDLEGSKASMEAEWDDFMAKSIRPGEDDDEEDDDDDDEDEEDGENEEDEDDTEDEAKEGESDEKDDEGGAVDARQEGPAAPANEEPSLAERCDRFMMPWIGCIQEHRDVYSLISNEFYQKDYVDPLEDAVPEVRRTPFSKSEAEIGETDGYVIRFDGAEIDLGSWREHVEADADVGTDDGSTFEDVTSAAAPPDEPHLINAYAKFRLNDPVTNRPVEVAYVKDQRGRLLGFDSFSKRDGGERGDDDGTRENDPERRGVASNDGECTFHIVPGETTSIVAYAIYRGERREDGEGEDGGMREDFLYRTPEIPLPGIQSRK